jgi:hypothetical protein
MLRQVEHMVATAFCLVACLLACDDLLRRNISLYYLPNARISLRRNVLLGILRRCVATSDFACRDMCLCVCVLFAVLSVR